MNDPTTNDRSFVEHLDETIAHHLSDEHFGVEELAREMGVDPRGPPEKRKRTP